MSFDFKESIKQYQELATFMAMRQNELSDMLHPYVAVTDRYGILVTTLTMLLGHVKPKSNQERVIRDLTADAFDFLYAGRRTILQGQLEVSYPVLRRAYESISLLVLCALDEKYAEKWQGGAQIGNAEIRDELAKHRLGEPKDRTRELYTFFSKASHPNRGLVSERYLGDGNEFVLGAIGHTSLALVVDYCKKHLQMCFWLGAVLTHRYQELLATECPAYFAAYSNAAKLAEETASWLIKQFNHLLEEEQGELGQDRQAK